MWVSCNWGQLPVVMVTSAEDGVTGSHSRDLGGTTVSTPFLRGSTTCFLGNFPIRESFCQDSGRPSFLEEICVFHSTQCRFHRLRSSGSQERQHWHLYSCCHLVVQDPPVMRPAGKKKGATLPALVTDPIFRGRQGTATRAGGMNVSALSWSTGMPVVLPCLVSMACRETATAWKWHSDQGPRTSEMMELTSIQANCLDQKKCWLREAGVWNGW